MSPRCVVAVAPHRCQKGFGTEDVVVNVDVGLVMTIERHVTKVEESIFFLFLRHTSQLVAAASEAPNISTSKSPDIVWAETWPTILHCELVERCDCGLEICSEEAKLCHPLQSWKWKHRCAGKRPCRCDLAYIGCVDVDSVRYTWKRLFLLTAIR
jgi:hypothetical protein